MGELKIVTVDPGCELSLMRIEVGSELPRSHFVVKSLHPPLFLFTKNNSWIIFGAVLSV